MVPGISTPGTPYAAARPATRGRPGRRRLGLEPFLYTLLLLALVVMVFVPFLLLLIASFRVGGLSAGSAWSLEGWRTALDAGITGATLWNTVALALVRTGISLPLAIFLAWLLARTDLPRSHSLEFLFWIAFFLPALPVVQGWVLMLDPEYGLLNQAVERLPFVEQGPFNIFSWWGIVWAHLVTGTVAIKVMLLTPVFRNLDASHEEASRMAGASALGTLVRIVVPVMRPAILAVMLIAIVRALESFEIELFLGAPERIDVYSTSIYRMLHREPALYESATALSILVLAVMFPLVLLQRWVTDRRRYSTVTGQYKGQRLRLGRWRWPAFALVLGIALVLTLLPVAFLLIGTFMKLYGWFEVADPWTLDNWRTVLQDPTFLRALRNTVALGVGAALLGVISYAFIAYVCLRTRFWGRGLIDLLSWFPLGLPGVILGVGFLLLFLGIPLLRPLYGTLVPLVIAITVGSMTTGVQITRASLANLGFDLEEASWSAGANKLYTLRRIVLPLSAPVLVTVAITSFVAAARNISYIALLSAGETQPLSMLQLNYSVDGRYEAGAVVGLIIAALTVGMALVARAIGLRLGTRV